MPEPRFSGLPRSNCRHKTVPRRSPSPSIVTRPPRDALQPGGACCRRGSSTRSAPSPAPARHYVPASRPCRCSGPEDMLDGTRTTNGSRCLLLALAQRLVAAALAMDPAPQPLLLQAASISAERKRRCCPHPGYRRGLGCRAPPRRSHDSAAPACARSTHGSCNRNGSCRASWSTAPRHPFGAALPACPPSLAASRPPLSARSPRGCCAVWVPPQSMIWPPIAR